ncbi:uncharacterized protein ACA1_044260 [Acanthamoeba castellanii str. Neff]|uniref:Uncharacterized protein n=1 Tax=Acanthamoeba castellanii (strain ATCC 30010 / Neff) TaxID=1257118 RepID=L8HFE2_ACACF|nr:uncharacterized protein ACA1_044260 [Acanthamoeba castellanii str. Neff]ELR23121.1 hypothetical protein ACA1_044260 [Acanthamoeba castellanii str. Neff]
MELQRMSNQQLVQLYDSASANNDSITCDDIIMHAMEHDLAPIIDHVQSSGYILTAYHHGIKAIRQGKPKIRSD